MAAKGKINKKELITEELTKAYNSPDFYYNTLRLIDEGWHKNKKIIIYKLEKLY